MNLEVTLAGTVAARGIYTENGTYNSAAAYELEGGAFWIWWQDSLEYWILSAAKGDAFELEEYYYSVGVTPLTSDHAWSVGTLGDSPAPTVAEYSGGGGGGTLTSTGWLSPTLVEDISEGDVWVSPDNCKAEDDAYATYTATNTAEVGLADEGSAITCTGFALDAIAAEDTIVGVAVQVAAWADESISTVTAYPFFAKLVTAGGLVGDNLGHTDTALPTSDADVYEQFGGSAEDWGAGLDGSDMDADFGVRLLWQCNVPAPIEPSESESCAIKLDHVRIKVWYLDADGAGGSSTRHVFMGVM